MFAIPGLFTLAAALGAAPTSSNLAISPCDAGEHYQFEIVECPIELKNLGKTPLHVSKARTRFAWDSVDSGTIVVPPNGVAYLNAKVDVRESEGRTVRPFAFEVDEPGNTRRGSEVRVFALSVLDQAKPTLDFGAVKIEDEMPERSITLSSREAANFRITGVESKPDWLDVHIGDDGRTVVAKLKPSAPFGVIHHNDFVKLKINAPQQKEAWVAIEAQLLGDVVADGNPFQLGLLRKGTKHEFLIRVSSRSGKPVKLGAVTLESIKGTAALEPCTPASPSCQLVRVAVSDENPASKLEGLLKIELPEAGKPLPIELVGMLINADTKIHSMDEVMAQSGAQSQTEKPASGVNLQSAIKSAFREAEPPPPGTGPLLKWSAAHQEAIYGYVIYRADAAAGPFLRVNKEIIRTVEEGDDKAGTYQWRDNDVVSGKTYWYSIGVINRNGSRQDLSGAQKVVAK